MKRATIVFVLLSMSLLSGCLSDKKTELESTTTIVTVTQPDAQQSGLNLAWKNVYWDLFAGGEIDKRFDSLSKAKDITKICPKFKSLTRPQKIKVLGEFLAGITYFESKWNTKAVFRECSKSCIYSGGCKYTPPYGYCMKGGHALDQGIVISRGLFQISLESAIGYGCEVSKPDDLHDPYRNISCGTRILSRLVERKGSFTVQSGNYWAVLKDGSKYGKVSEITKMVKKTGLCE